ncbi:MAG: molecular chaperone DnaK [Alphaproteobacteria bacterium HGW-Alphaproteobacteria-6]|nr:MAG: molecular chaperone DnaK [Alphaproteobacteria bacterium HGW-Alphaproteobacteria-6]
MGEPTPEALKSRYLPRLQEELASLRQASADTADHRRPVTLDQQSVGRLSRMDAMQQQAMAAAQDTRRHARIRALDAALRRIEGQDFGWCDACGDFIGEPRLDIDPTIMRCRDCAR